MPADRYNNIANSTRPLMPSLASNRTAKTPIAPRLATSITPSSSTSSRRTLYDSGASTGANTTPKSVSREDLSTPVKAFISSNITPRSSSRKSRVDSRESTPSGTPSGTPTPSRPASFIDTQAAYESHAALSGLGLSNVPVKGPKSLTNGTTVSHVPSSTRVLPNSTHTAVCSDTATREDPQKFFHANSVRLQEPSQGQKKVPTFFYANGQSETKPRILSVPSPPLSSTSQGPFLHTDDVPEERKPVSSILTGSPESSLSMSSHPLSPAFRPPSPAKENILLSDRKGASQVIRSHQHRPSAVHMISGRLHTMSTTETDTVQRNTSIASATKPRRGNHAKSASLSSIDSTPRKHYHRSIENSSNSATTPLQTRLQASPSSASATSPSDILPTAPSISVPQSPTKPTLQQQNIHQLNELAANARRERKVLDLEISNSSLLAINRQLEREVRKQKAELRRYRRLSRAGRLSNSTIRDSFDGNLADSGLYDMPEEDEEDEEDDLMSSSEDSVDEAAMSPAALADLDAKHIQKDERRLQLDLAKHRELLLDSQKINQSLKRCLLSTEEMIKEGKRALEHRVRVDEVKLGGRILTAEEREDEAREGLEEEPVVSPGGTLLSSWIPKPGRLSMESERTDGDSGVDVASGAQSVGDEISTICMHVAARSTVDLLGDTF